MLLEILRYILIFVEIMCSFLLIVAILLQRTKGGGMGLAFGTAMGESLFGAQVGNVLTKTTVVLAIVFLMNTTVLAVIGARGARQGSVTDGLRSAPVPVAAPMPVPSEMPVSTAPDLPLTVDTPVTAGEE